MAEVVKSRRSNKKGIIIGVISGVLVLAVLGVMFSLWVMSPSKPAPGSNSTIDNGTNEDTKDNNDQSFLEQIKDHFRPKQASALTDTKKKSNVYSFLVCGVDKDAVRTDTILLGTYDINAGTLNIMQIPRDTFINTDHKYKKINTSYAYGGIDELKKEVYETFGIEVDRYVVFKTTGFVKVVDLIGGVKIDVPRDMNYEDPSQDLYIHLKKGEQVLDGAHAEQFVRYRKGYAEGDIGRLNAQKLFLSAFVDQLLSMKNVLKLPELAGAVIESVKTDMSVNEMVYFGVNAMNIQKNKITVYMALGEPVMYEGVSYYSLYSEENREIINKSFNPYVTDIASLDIEELSRKNVSYYTIHKDGQNMADIGGTSTSDNK